VREVRHRKEQRPARFEVGSIKARVERDFARQTAGTCADAEKFEDDARDEDCELQGGGGDGIGK
jgi:hypothetical protein